MPNRGGFPNALHRSRKQKAQLKKKLGIRNSSKFLAPHGLPVRLERYYFSTQNRSLATQRKNKKQA
jgi:hypothetical protein